MKKKSVLAQISCYPPLLKFSLWLNSGLILSSGLTAGWREQAVQSEGAMGQSSSVSCSGSRSAASPWGGCWGTMLGKKKGREKLKLVTCGTQLYLVSLQVGQERDSVFENSSYETSACQTAGSQYNSYFPAATQCSSPGFWFTEELSGRWKCGFEPAGNQGCVCGLVFCVCGVLLLFGWFWLICLFCSVLGNDFCHFVFSSSCPAVWFY